jgi:hypothetical protein
MMRTRAAIAQDETLLGRILAGESLRQVGRAYGLAPERVRQIVGWQARQRNPVLYDDLMADLATVSVVLLRQHAAAFMAQLAQVEAELEA